MAYLASKVQLYLEANSKTFESEMNNFVLQNNSDGAGDFIASWNVSGLAEPTEEQLATYDSDGDVLESNKRVISTRVNLYGSLAKQLEYIVENGVDAFITRQNQIKSDNPKG